MTTEPSQVPVVWVGLEDSPAPMTNLFLAQVVGPGEIVLNLGQLIPPPLLGTPESQAEQISQFPFVQARALGRFALTPARAEELYTLLGKALEQAAIRGNP
jgi:hypothetical protein